MKSLKLIIVILFIFALLTGCESSVEEDVGEGTIVISLSRNITNETEEASYSGFTTDAISTLSEENNDWPRSVKDVQEALEGYRINIKGEGVDTYKDAFFEEDEDEVTIEVSIPAGDDYSVTMIAVGEGHVDTNLLGAGQTTGIIVESEETTFVTVEMEPYKYNFEAPEQVQTGEEIDITFELKGPLKESLITSSYMMVYYSKSELEHDWDGDTIRESKEIIEKNHWQWAFVIPGASEEGSLFFQFGEQSRIWDYDGIKTFFHTPSISLNEEIPTVEIGEADSSVVIKPEW